MKKATLLTVKQCGDILLKQKSVGLICHTNSDGDTVGSAAALCLMLRSYSIEADVFCDMSIDQNAQFFLPDEITVKNTIDKNYSLLVAVDCADVYRTGLLSGEFNAHPNTLAIDHHAYAPFSRNYLWVNYSSTAEIILEIARYWGKKLDSVIATQLFIGLSIDTGNFSHSNTDKHAFTAAAELSEYGVDIALVNRVFYDQMSFARAKLLGKVLSKIRRYFDGQFCVVYAAREDIESCGATKQDASDIVDYAVNIEGCKIGVSLMEAAPNVFKISLRGNKTPVRDIAEIFGGGGHSMAAGCQISGVFEDVLEKLLKAVGDKLK